LGTAYPDGATYPFTTSARSHAQWTRTPYTVTFNANGGTGTMAAETDNAPTALTPQRLHLDRLQLLRLEHRCQRLGHRLPRRRHLPFTDERHALRPVDSDLLPALLLAFPAFPTFLPPSSPPSPPTVTGVSPHLWPGLGAYSVTITGTGFSTGAGRHRDRLRYHLGLGK